MALTFQGVSFADINSGAIASVSVRQQGTGSFVDVGAMADPHVFINALSEKGDPANTDYVYSISYKVSWITKQTKTTGEVSSMAGAAGTGLFDTDVEVLVTCLLYTSPSPRD